MILSILMWGKRNIILVLMTPTKCITTRVDREFNPILEIFLATQFKSGDDISYLYTHPLCLSYISVKFNWLNFSTYVLKGKVEYTIETKTRIPQSHCLVGITHIFQL